MGRTGHAAVHGGGLATMGLVMVVGRCWSEVAEVELWSRRGLGLPFFRRTTGITFAARRGIAGDLQGSRHNVVCMCSHSLVTTHGHRRDLEQLADDTRSHRSRSNAIMVLSVRLIDAGY